MRAVFWMILGLGLLAQATPGVTPSERFQQAITLMDSRGDYTAAVTLFEEVAGSPDRGLAARALIFMGECYERMGRAEAERAYRRVLEQFPDQKVAADEARARLAALGSRKPKNAAAATVRLRRTWPTRLPDMGMPGCVSRDGRAFAYIDMAAELALGDLTSGERLRRVARAVDGTFSIASGPIPSPDATAVAYAWEPKTGATELRVAVNESVPPRVLYRTEPGESVAPIDWPAGDRLLVAVTHTDRRVTLGLVRVREARYERVVTIAAGPSRAALSPDGRFIVFDAPLEDTAGGALFIVPASGGKPRPLTPGPSDDRLPIWTAAGDRIVFVSDRTGTPGLWAQRVVDGTPQGRPELLQELGRVIVVLGLTEDGAYHYFRQVGLVDVMTVALDAEGMPRGEPRGVGTPVGSNLMPTFSPDGRTLAFVGQVEPRRDEQAPGESIRLHDVTSGRARTIQTDMKFLRAPRWASGQHLLVKGNDGDGRFGFHTLDLTTGNTSPILTVPPQAEDTLGPGYWMGNQGAIAYMKATGDGSQVIVRRAIDSGDEDVLFRGDKDAFIAAFAVSPTGSDLAIIARRKTSASLILARRGEPHERWRLEKTEALTGVAWMPDGRRLLVVRSRSDQPARGSLWMLDADAGEPKALGLEMDRLRDLAISPSGDRLAFTTGAAIREPWIVEGFLPTGTSR